MTAIVRSLPAKAAPRSRKPASAPRMRESMAQKAIITEHKFRGVRGTRIVGIINEGEDRRSKWVRMEYVGRGMWPGFPDLLVIGPALGQVRTMELKVEGGTLSAEQLACHAALRSLGIEVHVAWDLFEALSTLEVWGVLRPDRNMPGRAAA